MIAPPEDGRCYVHYEGFDDYYNEWVTADRIRPATGLPTEPAPSLKPISDELWHVGFVCTGYNAQVLFTFGFTVLPGHRYADMSGAQGTYSIDVEKRTITFTGAGWDGRSGVFSMDQVFTHYGPDGREVTTCRPIVDPRKR